MQTLHITDVDCDFSTLAQPETFLDEPAEQGNDTTSAEQDGPIPMPSNPSTGSTRLEAIPEEPSDYDSETSAMLALVAANLEELDKLQVISRNELSVNDLPMGLPHKPTDPRVYVVEGSSTVQCDERDTDTDGNPYVEMLFPGDTAKLILDAPPPVGHTAAMLVYNTHSKKSVVETDQDLLTNEEYRKYPSRGDGIAV